MIRIGERDIHEYALEAFHEAIVTVDQIPFLFSKTIAENVRFGKEEATQAEIESVSIQADLHDTVQEFPQRYETLVGERGVTLSGGQKQRVAMARAFLVNRSILLLDDIFAAVDAATEKRIFKAMKVNFTEKTVLLVTNRVWILEQMDRIIYMKAGKILEDGSPDELKKQKGHYAALVDLQAGR
jgi:ATP-binding cassette subfamily B protein